MAETSKAQNKPKIVLQLNKAEEAAERATKGSKTDLDGASATIEEVQQKMKKAMEKQKKQEQDVKSVHTATLSTRETDEDGVSVSVSFEGLEDVDTHSLPGTLKKKLLELANNPNQRGGKGNETSSVAVDYDQASTFQYEEDEEVGDLNSVRSEYAPYRAASVNKAPPSTTVIEKSV